MVVKMLPQPDFRYVARPPQKLRDLIERACGRARRVLGVHGKHEHALAAFSLLAGERTGDRRLAVTHGKIDRERHWDVQPEVAVKQSRLPLGVHPERGSLGRPYAGVLPRGLPRP